jgi:GH18 family chitinase
LSVAVPAKKVDRELSFPKESIEEINTCVDDWNLMTYDLMNRRDLKTTHHAGSQVIKDVVDYYSNNGIKDKKKM